ncbi:hypothetical protein [Acidihalobacter ferrooxydans]|uniref:hypothetical protein n=1 Tax=Acidihalobacter ferrooxydans TaxID=1765967 RepID=UPI0018DBAB76|nr:hypothetical protein [Acidihalobacter ferrooxydans]
MLDYISTSIYLFAAIALMVMALATMFRSVYEVYQSLLHTTSMPDGFFIPIILQSVGAIVIAVAILDVAKYMVEEEVFRNKQLRSAVEARRTLTKIIVIAIIAVTIEALIYIFKAGTKDLALLVYPAALLGAVVFLLIGLGAYQRLSVDVEKRHNEQ